MTEAFICDAVRTPIGRYGGVLSGIRPDDLGAVPIRALMERNQGVDWQALDDVVYGCANQAGEDNRNVARMALLLAGFPDSVPGVTVNRLCASGLEAVNQAARMVACGEAEIVIAGGVESMSRAPYVLPKQDAGWPNGNLTAFDTTLGWRFPNPAMEALFPLEPMGETAENVAVQESISRGDQDAFALRSHVAALAAQEAGRFKEEIIAVEIAEKKGASTVVDRDEQPRADTNLESLGKLNAAFRKGGTVTAGNSSSLNDGAAALMLMGARQAAALGLTPLAHWVGASSAGVSPRVMGLGPVPAVKKLLARVGWSLDQVDLLELNEAFAAQALAVTRGLGMTDEVMRQKVNVNGGAIALGHPLGCSGARILTTLLFEMKRRNVKRGLASLCVGVGQGVATVVERR